jgi:hypothetical protein
MKNVIKGLIIATFAMSFAACNNDKAASSTATTSAAPTTDAAATTPSTSMATTDASTAAATTTTDKAVPTATTAAPVKPSAAQTTPPPPPPPAPAAGGKTTSIKFDELAYNWGSINEEEKMTHNFKFKNIGTNDLIISDARGSCGCTVPEWPKEPIKPGKTGEIKVVFDSKGKPGDQQKTVTLTANTDPANSVLTIKGAVKPKPADKG